MEQNLDLDFKMERNLDLGWMFKCGIGNNLILCQGIL
jgi:hypothetical protein